MLLLGKVTMTESFLVVIEPVALPSIILLHRKPFDKTHPILFAKFSSISLELVYRSLLSLR